jgi:transposase
MENQEVVSLARNAPAHRSVLVKDFLAKNNVTTLQPPPHSPDLDPTDFYVPSTETSIEGMAIL